MLCFAMITLAGCGPVYNTSYTYKSPRAWRGRMCVNTCLQQRNTCSLQCKEMNSQCRETAIIAARPAYKAYLRHQRHHHKTAWKSVNDFADFSQCNNVCNCAPNYNQCFENCGGRIIAHTRCVAFCKKPKPHAASKKATSKSSKKK